MKPIVRSRVKTVGSLLSAALAFASLSAGARAAKPVKSDEFPPSAVVVPTKISPNKLTAAQAQQVLLADHDTFWQQALNAYPAALATPAIPAARWNLFAHGERTKKEIALTFDDGPHPAYTPELLKVLKEYHVPATFFLVGEMAEKSPDLVRQEIADGHEVGNHTYHHVSLIKITPDQAAAEIRACDMVLESITDKPVRLFRPPGGKYDPSVAREASAQGYTTVLWTDDPGDYSSPGVDVIEERTIKTAHSGGILLLHDGIQETIDALPYIIEKLRAQGYTFVTVDQMLAQRTTVTPVKGIAKLVSVARPAHK